MTNQNTWEEFYNKIPLEKISWQKVQSDYFSNIINSDKVNPGTALDLGCGTGIKSIFLTQRGFEVTGVDISKTAIDYANKNAQKADVKINFIAADATDLSFLDDKKFDLILDWANLHGIEKEKRKQYIQEIVNHTKKGSKLILRCFGRKKENKEAVTRPMGVISLFTKAELEQLYSKYFKILETSTSNPPNKNAPGKFFHEFLMERI
jgi:2-polyprenyl-3-methyl-5-hydroxy-6-metoxy-1,4-benzoquinol methylase